MKRCEKGSLSLVLRFAICLRAHIWRHMSAVVQFTISINLL